VSSSTSGATYVHTFTLTNPISIQNPGKHVISFYTYFECKKQECDIVGDTLSIQIKDGGDYDEVFVTGSDYGRYNDSRWKKDEVLTNFKETQIFVRHLNKFFNYKVSTF
jgi:hypothetical protein